MSDENAGPPELEPADSAPPSAGDPPQAVAIEPPPSATVTPPDEGAAVPPPEAPPVDPALAEMRATLEAQSQSIAENAKQLEVQKAEARARHLEAMGVLPQYRDTAPTVDPFTVQGREALETWAQARPEIRRKTETTVADVDMASLTKGLKSGHLIDIAANKRAMRLA